MKSEADRLLEDAEGSLADQVRLARDLFSSAPAAAAEKLYEVVLFEGEANDKEPYRIKEAAVYLLGDLFVQQNDGQSIKQIFTKARSFFLAIPKARTARIVRTSLDLLAKIPGMEELQEQLCLDTIQWCRDEHRTFLRHRVETRLALLYNQIGRYTKGLEVIHDLLSEVKKLDDKLLLVEIHFIEAKLHFSVRNNPKAKAALTAARSNANAIHCPPLLQAEIDILAGALHLEDRDSQTAYSYFFEAFEAFHLNDDPKAIDGLKLMLLSKIMSDRADEVSALIRQKQYVKYVCRVTESFKMIAESYHKRDLRLLEEALRIYKPELQDDPMVHRHANQLYQALLEKNLLKLLEPFSRVEVQHVAKLIELPTEQIQLKLEEMILDKKLNGILDQSNGTVMLFDDPPVPTMFSDGAEIFSNLAAVTELLRNKTQKVL